MMDLSTRQSMKKLRTKTELSEGNVQSNARRVIKGLGGLFVTIFTGLFGAVISRTGNFTVAFLGFGTAVLSAIFLYFYIQSRKEVNILKSDQLTMAKTQISMVDTMEEHFQNELKMTMKNIETKYADTITGLTCQINDLIKATVEEKEKLHGLMMVLTTEEDNGIENMTTEREL